MGVIVVSWSMAWGLVTKNFAQMDNRGVDFRGFASAESGLRETGNGGCRRVGLTRLNFPDSDLRAVSCRREGGVAHTGDRGTAGAGFVSAWVTDVRSPGRRSRVLSTPRGTACRCTLLNNTFYREREN